MNDSDELQDLIDARIAQHGYAQDHGDGVTYIVCRDADCPDLIAGTGHAHAASPTGEKP